ncbi:MAG: hypothetical protein NZO16_04030, partial [Deltaproteobacteria bacterium]|nr:hypothetical protein [Deltaproteobacteria bacterium]
EIFPFDGKHYLCAVYGIICYPDKVGSIGVEIPGKQFRDFVFGTDSKVSVPTLNSSNQRFSRGIPTSLLAELSKHGSLWEHTGNIYSIDLISPNSDKPAYVFIHLPHFFKRLEEVIDLLKTRQVAQTDCQIQYLQFLQDAYRERQINLPMAILVTYDRHLASCPPCAVVSSIVGVFGHLIRTSLSDSNKQGEFFKIANLLGVDLNSPRETSLSVVFDSMKPLKLIFYTLGSTSFSPDFCCASYLFYPSRINDTESQQNLRRETLYISRIPEKCPCSFAYSPRIED